MAPPPRFCPAQQPEGLRGPQGADGGTGNPPSDLGGDGTAGNDAGPQFNRPTDPNGNYVYLANGGDGEDGGEESVQISDEG